jgi:hypothetical protein
MIVYEVLRIGPPLDMLDQLSGHMQYVASGVMRACDQKRTW